VIVPPALENTLGIRRSDLIDPGAGLGSGAPTDDSDDAQEPDHERNAPVSAGARRAAAKEAEVAAK
jgi:hypothetical protein